MMRMTTFSHFLTVSQGLSKSKRKEFRDKELERLREREKKKTENVTSGKGNDTKVDNALDFIPPPRRPSVEIPLLRLGRLAAKFPDHLGKDSSEQKCCSIKSSNQDAETTFIPSGGRGRGILGPTATAWGNF
uniref:Uncharacterized protein n=1 Tax=Daphnia galeata TaxID=27404 RepID=A0A8J2S1K2_9CRUS|nr:unnamed protein product [Daphnia galeata]